MMIERWVKVKGIWMHVVITDDKTYINGEDCEYRQHFEDTR